MEKQINELAADIYSMTHNDNMSRALASYLYDKGYRKQGVAKKDYYTPEEVRRMSQSEVRDNITAIRRSMKTWG